ncbi:CBM35 domain-containing protein [Leifsonia sp. fls2-241-R2A-40a]|uniref:CBM35 domain-containing protein n=1 Tax=Leifsonia sp. fls2-241-R2A-40a TaxID=3040290 RepID=UPI00254A756B|nr:CBM35 domain-containing protein [Leifsonia sp. fls2-241-R2A-40a]
MSGLASGPVTFTYDDADSHLVYSSTGWTHGSGVSYATEYDSTKSFASAAGSKMTVDFTGSTIRLIGLKGPNYGTATIKIDGTTVGTFDGYATTQLHDQVMYVTSGLSTGSHELVLTVDGAKDAPSTGTYISVDAVDLHATDQRSPAGGTLTYNNVSVPNTGAYSLRISYVNPNAADQYATVTPNGGTSTTIALPPTGSSNATGTAIATINLNSGSNSIVIGAPSSSSDTEIDTISIPQPQS